MSFIHVFMPGPWTALVGQMDRQWTETDEGALVGPWTDFTMPGPAVRYTSIISPYDKVIQLPITCLHARPVDRLSWAKGTDDQRRPMYAPS